MRRCNPLLLAIFTAFLLGSAHSQYWFQYGVRAGGLSAYNNGTSLQIQTISPQNISSGSLAFWVGEDLSDGSFLQEGYVIENQSGRYPSVCTISGCSGYEYLTAGQPEWFYEYFPGNYSGSQFLGRVGPLDSAGPNGTINTYSIYYSGSAWRFLLNGAQIGSVQLRASSSGSNFPVAFGELANASNADTYVHPVIMANLSYYAGSLLIPARRGYAYIGYGVGSLTNLKNPYGVSLADSQVNLFRVGSGLAQPRNGTQLWSIGYYIHVESEYGNISRDTGYLAYSRVEISAPAAEYLNDTARVLFTGWRGTGVGSYSGSANKTSVVLGSNITEAAEWQLQYLANISSAHNDASGSGWHNAGSEFSYSINSTVAYENSTVRYVFSGWSNGQASSKHTAYVNGPMSIAATWQRQYFLNVSSDYGNATGSGWHTEGTSVTLGVSPAEINISNNERFAFYSWSTGSNSSTTSITVDSPERVRALFREQYVTHLLPVDSSGMPLSGAVLYIDGAPSQQSLFLFENKTYTFTGSYYKGTFMPMNVPVSVSQAGSMYVRLPVYNVTVLTTDIFGIPVNASGTLAFENRTEMKISSGSSGSIRLQDVPLGVAKGSLGYFLLSMPVNTYGGAAATAIFISPFDLLVFAVVIAASVLIHELANRHHRKRAIPYNAHLARAYKGKDS